MQPTKEEAIAELRRRGVAIPGQPMMQQAAKPTRDEAIAELKRRGVPIPGEQSQTGNIANILSYLNPFSIAGNQAENMRKTALGEANPLMAGIESFAGGVERRTHGIAQPVLENYLGPRVAQASRDVAQEREQRLAQNAQQFPKATAFGEILGGEAAKAPLYAAGGLAARATPALAKVPGFLKYLGGIMGSTASGGLGGAAKYVNPDESRLENAISGAETGLAAGTLGAGLGLTLQAGLGAKNLISAYMKTHPAEKFAKEFIKNYKNVKKGYGKEYKDVFTKAKEAGVDEIQIPKINTKDIFEHAAKSEKKYVKNLLTSGKLYDAHRAQSDLGVLISRLSGKKGLTGSEKDAIQAAQKAQTRIKDSIDKSLVDKGANELAEKYKLLTQGYAKDVIPYRASKAVDKFNRKRPLLTPEKFRKKLAAEDAFEALVGAERHPELYKSKDMQKLIKNLTSAAGIYGAHKLIEGKI